MTQLRAPIAAPGTSPGAGAAGAAAGPEGRARGQQKQQHGVQGAGVGPSWVLLPLLSMLLPDAGEEALQLLAAAAAQVQIGGGMQHRRVAVRHVAAGRAGWIQVTCTQRCYAWQLLGH